MYYAASANSILLYAGSLSSTATASDSAFHAFSNLYSGAASSITVDGITTVLSPTSPGTNGLTPGGSLAVGVASGNLTGTYCESGWLNNTISSGDQTTLNTNMHNGYSF
jgi:hypothetical protein